MPTRKEQAALTRQKILTVTKTKISEDGYDNIRIVDIAKACNMSAGNFYNYYKSLDELFHEIDSIEFYESFDSLQTDNDLPVLTRIESYFHDWINLALNQYGSDYMYNWTQRYTTKTPLHNSDERVSLIVKHITNILKESVAKGELLPSAPADHIAYTIAFILFGCSAHFGITDDKESILQWSEYFYTSFIKPALTPYLTQVHIEKTE